MSICEQLNRIFKIVPDCLSPAAFIGATFSTNVNGRLVSFEITEIRGTGNDDAAAEAIVRNRESGATKDIKFPGHALFAEALWDNDDLVQKIEEAEAEITRREELVAQRLAKTLAERERQQKIESDIQRRETRAKNIETLRRLAFDYAPADLTAQSALVLLRTLDEFFDDIAINDTGSAGFVARQISRSYDYGIKANLVDKEKKWLQNVAKGVIRREKQGG